MPELVAISSEDEVWDVLENLISGSPGPAMPDLLQNFAWQPVLLYLPDDLIGHSVTPSLAKALTEFHSSLARSYAYLVYGRTDLRRLRADDEEVLDFRMLTVSGSNGVKINNADLANLLKRITAKMKGTQITLSVILLLVLYFSAPVAQAWIHEHYEALGRDRASRERGEMSEQETQRLKLVTTALSQHPDLKPIAELADQSKEPLMRSVIGRPRAKVLGADVTGDEAKALVSKPKEIGHGKRLDGVYEVVEIDRDNPDGFTSTLRKEGTQDEFSVSINLAELPEEDVQALFDALRGKRSVQARVNAYVVGEKVTAATVVRVDPTAKGE
jgi:hypothetical protein